MGDPAGIGPEIVLKSLASVERTSARSFVVYGCAQWLERLAVSLGISVDMRSIHHCVQVSRNFAIGKTSAEGGAAAVQAVRAAALDALAGKVRAVVTAPLNKEAMNLAGHHYPGHTELLAELAGDPPVRMMLANRELRTVLVSIHEPLRIAVSCLSKDRVLQTIQLTYRFLRRTGFQKPRIAVAGLNPHAGEGGLLGDEEIKIITPAIKMARAEGIDASGPWPPDTVFMRARGFKEFDVVVAMYHDQGLIPVKYLGINEGVNLTVGLPFIRTSPDHGTAFDIAEQGTADPASFLEAMTMADQLSRAMCADKNSDSC